MQALTVALPTMVKRGQRYQEIPAGPSACDTFTTVCLTHLFLFTKYTATAFSGTARSGTNDMRKAAPSPTHATVHTTDTVRRSSN